MTAHFTVRPYQRTGCMAVLNAADIGLSSVPVQSVGTFEWLDERPIYRLGLAGSCCGLVRTEWEPLQFITCGIGPRHTRARPHYTHLRLCQHFHCQHHVQVWRQALRCRKLISDLHHEDSQYKYCTIYHCIQVTCIFRRTCSAHFARNSYANLLINDMAHLVCNMPVNQTLLKCKMNNDDDDYDYGDDYDDG